MTAKLKVAVIGGTGLLGSHLVAGFLANGGYHVTVVTRENGDASKLAPLQDQGVQVVKANFEDVASLAKALEGRDIVLSAVGTAGLPGQLMHIEAAVAAGVKRYVPSEFGLDSGAPGFREYFPARRAKYDVRDKLEASGLDWTYIITGFFMETQFSPEFLFDPKAGTITIKGDPHAKFATTSLKDVGRWTAEALRDPASKNATIYLRGQEVSYSDVLTTYEEVTGKPLKVTLVSSEELAQQIADKRDPFVDERLRAISEGWGNQPSDQIYRGADDKPVTLRDFIAAATHA